MIQHDMLQHKLEFSYVSAVGCLEGPVPPSVPQFMCIGAWS